MPAWNGYYLLIWQSPQPNLGIAGPGQADSGIPWVRKQLQTIYSGERTVKNPQFFDADLKKRAQTIIHLDNLTGAPNSTHLQTPD
jgi:general secretion pathway protein A